MVRKLNIPITGEENIIREENSYKNSLTWWNYVRWLSTIGFLAVGIFLMRLEGRVFSLETFIMVLVAINLLNLVYSFWLVDMNRNKVFPILHNLLDVVVFSMAVSLTGGLQSPIIWLYLVPIITSSITIGKRTGLLACIFSLISLSLVVPNIPGFENPELLRLPLQVKSLFMLQVQKIISYGCLFFMVYFISSFLSETLRRQNRVLILLNNLLDKRNRDITRAQEKVTKMEEVVSINRLARTFHSELNNPLAIISMTTEELIKHNATSRETLERLKAVREGVAKMRTVLGKLDGLYKPSYQRAMEEA